MAFTDDNVRWVLGEPQPVVDESQAFTDDNIQWVLGEIAFVLDETAGAAAGLSIPVAMSSYRQRHHG